jgi:hypothetical protein
MKSISTFMTTGDASDGGNHPKTMEIRNQNNSEVNHQNNPVYKIRRQDVASDRNVGWGVVGRGIEYMVV